jgi:starch phosphorylase
VWVGSFHTGYAAGFVERDVGDVARPRPAPASSWNDPFWVQSGGVKAIRRFTVRPVLPPRLTSLGELAQNLRWCWDGATQDLFATIDPARWQECGQDPVRLLGSTSADRLDELAKDEEFLARLDSVSADLHAYLTGDRWYQQLGPDAPR